MRRSRVPFRELHDVAVRPGALEHEAGVRVAAASSRMTGVETGEPISSSGLATNVSRANGSSAAALAVAASVRSARSA